MLGLLSFSTSECLVTWVLLTSFSGFLGGTFTQHGVSCSNLYLVLLFKMFICEFCDYQERNYLSFLRHYMRMHRDGHNKIKCPVPACFQRYSSRKTVLRHLQKKHYMFYQDHISNNQRHFGDVNDPDDTDNDEQGNYPNNPTDNNNEAQGPAIDNIEPAPLNISKIAVQKLVSIREKHKLTSSAVTDMSVQMSTLIDLAVENVQRDVVSALRKDDIECGENLTNLLQQRSEVAEICEGFDTQYKLEKSAENHLDIVKPVEINLGAQDTYHYVPVKESLNKLLSYEDVFAEVMNGHETQDNSLEDIMDGDLVKNHPVFSQGESLAVMLYFDEFSVTNPLRSRAKNYKLLACYMLLANLTPEQRSKRRSMQLVLLCRAKHVKPYGLTRITAQLVTDLKDLEESGLDVSRGEGDFHFSVGVLAVLGDNLSQHQLGGFVPSFSCQSPCRFCTISKAQLKEGGVGDARTPHSHDEQVEMVSNFPYLSSAYGINGPAALAELNSWHCTDGMPCDMAHDIFEGTGKHIVTLALQHSIDQGYLTFDELNTSLKDFRYHSSDVKDKPVQLSKKGAHIVVKQTFSQMWCLARLLPLIVGSRVCENDMVWRAMLMFLQCLEYICAPKLTRGHILVCDDLIHEYLDAIKDLEDYDVHETPKHHFLRHYKQQMLDFGPLKQIWTIRLEAKHEYFVDLMRLNRCRKNICKTLATRHQFSQVLYSGPLLFEDSVELVGAEVVPIVHLRPTVRARVQAVTEEDFVQRGKAVIVNHQKYDSATIIVTGEEDGMPAFQLVTCGFIINGMPYVSCQKLFTEDYEPHYNAYIVHRLANTTLLKVTDLPFRTPLGLYQVGNDEAVVLKHTCVFS